MKTIALINFSSNIFAFGMRSIENYLRSLGYNILTFYCANTTDNQTSLLRDSALFKLAEKLKDCDVIGISIISIHSLNRVKQVSEYLKKKTKAKIILGGTPVILNPHFYLKFSDYVCTGEGEIFFEYFLKTNDKSTIPNLGYKLDNGKIILNSPASLINVNQLSIPTFDFENTYFLIDDTLESLLQNPEPLYSQCIPRGYRVFRIRGCLFKCTYCVNNRLNEVYGGLGKKIRIIDNDKVIKEIEYAKRIIPNLKTVYFMEDDFTAQPTKDFENFIAQYQKRISLPIKFYSTLVTFTDKKLKILLKYDVKIEYVRFGLQSGSKRINEEVYKRRFDKDFVLNKIESVLSNNICMQLDMILNNPYENETDWVENIKFFSELGERIKRNNMTSNLLQFNMFSLMFYPGTELYDKAIEDKIIDENYVEKTLLTRHFLNHPFSIHNFLMFFYYLCLKNRFKIILKFIKEPVFIKYVNKLSLIRPSVLLEKPLWLLTVTVKRLF